MFGEKLVMVGAVVPTTKGTVLVADPLRDVTAMGPVVAPTGTTAVSVVAEAVTTAAPVPLNVTVFCDGVVLKPVPEMVTTEPEGPMFGVNSMIDTAPTACRVIESRFPTASYARRQLRHWAR